jgi:hypothetical protein
MRKCLEIFLLDASPGALESFFLGFPELGLGVRYIPSPDELVFSAAGLGRPTSGQPRTRLSSLSLSRATPC